MNLRECELPCWNGIVPGQTTFADARSRMLEEYGDTEHYLLDTFVDSEMAGLVQFQVTNIATGYSFIATMLIQNYDESGQQRVRYIAIRPFTLGRSHHSPALLPDFYSIVGDTDGIVINRASLDVPARMFFKDFRVAVTIRVLPCHKVLLSQQIGEIYLFDPNFLGNTVELSGRRLQWQGFGRCYGDR